MMAAGVGRLPDRRRSAVWSRATQSRRLPAEHHRHGTLIAVSAIGAGADRLGGRGTRPSGDPEPWGEDLELTERLIRAGELLGIPVLDHVIVAAGGFRSLARNGRR